MPLLKHQLILHPDIVGQFALDKPVTPYERQVAFSWYLCPVIVADQIKRTPTLVERFFKPNRPLALTQQARAAIKKIKRTIIKRTPTLIA